MGMSEKQDEVRLLLDTPEKETIFGFDEYASALASAIIGTDPHFTIGIFGKWGSGKTTLLRKVETILNDCHSEKVLTVFFDAWRFQHEDHMLLPILDSISYSLKLRASGWGKANSSMRRLESVEIVPLILPINSLQDSGLTLPAFITIMPVTMIR